jgi:tetratricopeptide (TPR) repeat protein
MLKPRKRLVKAKLKEDKLLTFIARAQAWATKSQKPLLYGVGAAVVLAAGFTAIRVSRVSAGKTAAYEELLARDAFSRGDLDDALNRANAIASDYSGTHSASVASLLQGRIYEQRGELDEAEKAYRKLLGEYAGDEYLGFGALIGLGAVAYGREDFIQAGEFYKRAADKFPHHFSAAEALLNAGRAFKKGGKLDEARRVWRLALSGYPKSRLAGEIRGELENVEFMR